MIEMHFTGQHGDYLVPLCFAQPPMRKDWGADRRSKITRAIEKWGRWKDLEAQLGRPE